MERMLSEQTVKFVGPGFSFTVHNPWQHRPQPRLNGAPELNTLIYFTSIFQ